MSDKTTMLEAEVFILRHLVAGYTEMPPEEYFKAITAWHAAFIKRYENDASSGVALLQNLPETKAFYARIKGDKV